MDTTAHARQDTPATGVRQVGLNMLHLYAINVLLVNNIPLRYKHLQLLGLIQWPTCLKSKRNKNILRVLLYTRYN